MDLSVAENLAPKKPVTLMHKLGEALTSFEYYPFIYAAIPIAICLASGLALLSMIFAGVINATPFPHSHHMDYGSVVGFAVLGGFVTLVGLVATGIWLYQLEEQRISAHEARMYKWEREEYQANQGGPNALVGWQYINSGFSPGAPDDLIALVRTASTPPPQGLTMKSTTNGYMYRWTGSTWIQL